MFEHLVKGKYNQLSKLETTPKSLTQLEIQNVFRNFCVSGSYRIEFDFGYLL